MPASSVDRRAPIVPLMVAPTTTQPTSAPIAQSTPTSDPLAKASSSRRDRERFALLQERSTNKGKSSQTGAAHENSSAKWGDLIGELEKAQVGQKKMTLLERTTYVRNQLSEVGSEELADAIFHLAMHAQKCTKKTQKIVFSSISDVLNQLDSKDEMKVVEGAADWIARIGSVHAVVNGTFNDEEEQSDVWKDGMSSLYQHLSSSTVRYMKTAKASSDTERLAPRIPADCMMQLIVAIDEHLEHIGRTKPSQDASRIAQQLKQIQDECVQQFIEYRLSFNEVEDTLHRVAAELEKTVPVLSQLARNLESSFPTSQQTLQFAAPVFKQFMPILDMFLEKAEEEDYPELADLQDLKAELLEIEEEALEGSPNFLLHLKSALSNDDFVEKFDTLPMIKLPDNASSELIDSSRQFDGRRIPWLTKLKLNDALVDIADAEKKLEDTRELDLINVAQTVVKSLPSMPWAPSLNGSPYVRAYETKLATYAKDHLSTGLVHAADTMAQVLHHHLQNLDDTLLSEAIDYVREKAGAWKDLVPELNALLEATTASEQREALQDFFDKPDKSGWHQLAMPFLLSKVTIHFEGEDVFPWDEITFDRHAFILSQRDRERIGPRQSFANPMSGIISRHDPDDSVDPAVNHRVRPVDGFKLDLMNIAAITRKTLALGMPYGASVAGHTNMSLSMADYARQEQIGATDTKHILLLSLLSGVASGSHTFNEGLLAGYVYLWYGARFNQDVDKELADILSNPEDVEEVQNAPDHPHFDNHSLGRFLASFDGTKLMRLFSAFEGTETGEMLDQAQQLAIEKAKQDFQNNSHFARKPDMANI